jgi:hypothetical protein
MPSLRNILIDQIAATLADPDSGVPQCVIFPHHDIAVEFLVWYPRIPLSKPIDNQFIQTHLGQVNRDVLGDAAPGTLMIAGFHEDQTVPERWIEFALRPFPWNFFVCSLTGEFAELTDKDGRLPFEVADFEELFRLLEGSS